MKYSVQQLSKPISGNDLMLALEDEEFQSVLYHQKVAPGPEEALDKIRHFAGVSKISTHGADIEAITEIRDVISQLCSEDVATSLVVTAPHTHWATESAITYKWVPQDDLYIIGPHPLLKEAMYFPISFVFDKEGPLPYEWTDASINLNESQWIDMVSVIWNINSIVYKHDYPLGIAIEFRFKDSLFVKADSSIESPVEGTGSQFLGFSQIARLQQVSADEEVDYEQVSWHPYADSLLGLNDQEDAVLTELRKLLGATDSVYEKQNPLQLLEEAFGSKEKKS